MKSRFLFCTMSLLALLLVSSCAPAFTEIPVSPSTDALNPVHETAVPQSTIARATATKVAGVQPAATSRGPDLHATDPTTVSLASGQLQLVEFFRFT